MKKITLKNLLLACCLIFGIKSIQAQTCTVSIAYSVGPNGVVSFTGTGSPVNATTSYYWYLPGSTTPIGPQGNTAWNATATYTANGTYTVMFGMFSTSVPVCSVGITQTITVNTATTGPGPCVLNVQYTAPSPNMCNGSAMVTAPANMCGPVTYSWSNGINGSSIFGLCAGSSYTVMASSVSGINCCSLSVGSVNIPTVNPCTLNANFNWTQAAGGVVNFTDISTGTNGSSVYSWNFGDGNTSSSTSPAHTYTANGAYSVTLTINNSNPACSDTQVINIFVNSLCNLSAGFNYSYLTSSQVAFANTTTGNFGPVNYTWSFGDGNNGFGANPVHSYTATGTYTVLLTATNFSLSVTCVDTAVQVVTINTVCVANAGFSLSPTATPQYWNAFPLAPSNIIAAEWYWGDGFSSNTLYTSHAYASAGTYSICLSVTVSCGASATSCYSYSIYRSSQDQSMVYVNVVDPSVATGISAVGADQLDYSIYPNPNNGRFSLNIGGLSEGPVKVAVYNVIGDLVYSVEEQNSKGSLSKDIQLDGTSGGVYFIQVNASNKTFTKKVIVNR